MLKDVEKQRLYKILKKRCKNEPIIQQLYETKDSRVIVEYSDGLGGKYKTLSVVKRQLDWDDI